MRTSNTTMQYRTSAPHAVLHFRNAHNARYETATMRRTPNTLCGCWAVGVPAHTHLASTRPYADLTFSPSHLLCSPCTPHATRPTPGVCSCGSSWLQARRVVQHSAHTLKTRNRDQNSFRATRHAPNAQHNVMQHDRCSCGWVFLGHLTLSLLGSSLRTLTVPMNQCSFKASRRVRTTLYRICYAWNEGSPSGFSRITPLGTPLMECRAYLGQGGDASRVDSSTSPGCLLNASPTSSTRTHRATKKIAFKKSVASERFVLALRSAASKPHFSKYIARCLALPGGVGVEFRHDLMKRNYFASWVLNKYTAPIKIHFVPSVLAPFVAVVVQPHTTKSLTGGVLRTVLLGLSPDRSFVSLVKGLVMSVAASKLSGITVPADDETSVKVVLVMQPLLLTVEQVAQVLNFSRSKVYEFINVGDLPVLRFGRSVRVRVSSLEQWLNLQEEKAGVSQLRKVA